MTATSKRLPRGVRLAYGFGLSAEGIKSNAFNYFLLFYYQQIVGLDAVLCGLSLALSVVVDALFDPLVGSWSDGWKSKLGRRHPFMFAAILPLSLCFIAVFAPPKTGNQALLFGWLTFFSIATRLAMSMFTIPHQSLVAEFASDYDERTRLQTLRMVFAYAFGLFNAVLGYTVFLKDTPEYAQGVR